MGENINEDTIKMIPIYQNNIKCKDDTELYVKTKPVLQQK